MLSNQSKSIVLITGAFIGSECWDEWKAFFESKGYNCLAPCWPYKDGSPEELRDRYPDPEIASNRLTEVVDYFALIANTFEEKPILIGHSLGGLIVQLLLQRGLGTAGVAIQSFPPQGTATFKFSFLKAWWKAMGLLTSSRKPYMISFKKWKTHIANGLTDEEQKKSYYQYAIPESKLIIRDAFKSIARIKFNNQHPPLLFTSGDQDKMLPAKLNYNNYKKYKDDSSTTDYIKFKNCNHLMFYSPVWKEKAEFILGWLHGIR